MDEIGLFPLGLVLLPTEQVPLHIFEPRYRELIAECLDQEEPFGLVFAAATLGYGTGTLLAARLVGRIGIDRTIIVGGGALAGGGLAMLAVVLAGAISPLALAAARPAWADPRPAARAARAVMAPVLAASSRERRGISIASTRAGMSARSPTRIVQSANAPAP